MRLCDRYTNCNEWNGEHLHRPNLQWSKSRRPGPVQARGSRFLLYLGGKMTQTKMWAQTIRLIVWMGLVVPALQPAGAGAQWKLLFQSYSAGRDLTRGVYFLKLPGPPRIGFVIGSDTANNFRVSN